MAEGLSYAFYTHRHVLNPSSADTILRTQFNLIFGEIMVKRLKILLSGLVLIGSATSLWANDNAKEQASLLIARTSTDIEKDARGTFAKISSAKEPYQNKTNPGLFVYIFDIDENVIAHPDATLVGRNYKGTPDLKGKKFRDEIIEGAQKNGVGQVDYMFHKPGVTGLSQKSTYYKLVTGSDGNKYIVCSDFFQD